MSVDMLLQLLVGGISVGTMYGLIGLGFITIYNCTKVVNFPQGDFLMLGAIVTVYLLKVVHLPYLLAGVLAVAITALVGALIYSAVLAPVGLNAHHMILILATLGASMMIENSVLAVHGPYPSDLPPFTGRLPIRLGEVAVAPQSLWVILTAAVVLAAMYLIMNRTTLGKEMTAAATDPLAASLMGISIGSVARLSFVISASIGALAGLVVAPLLPLGYASGLMLGFKGITGGFIGGWGKSSGAVIGGVILGLIETFAAGFLPTGYKDAITFVVLILVLYFRPTGIMGAAMPEPE